MLLRNWMITFTMISLLLVSSYTITPSIDGVSFNETEGKEDPTVTEAPTEQGSKIGYFREGGGMRIHFTMDHLLVTPMTIDGESYSTLDIGRDSTTVKPGMPMLPTITYLIAVPETDVGIEIVPERMDVINVGPIAPFQEPPPDVWPPSSQEIVIDDNYYSSPARYPEGCVDITSRGNIGDIPFVRIELNPISILNDRWDIEVILECSVEIKWKANTGRFIIPFGDPMLSVYERTFFDWSEFREGYVSMSNMDTSLNGNGCEYLIITDPLFVNASRKLAAWKNQMGILTSIYYTDQIGTKARDMRDFIKNAYDTWSPRPSYVLLMGDAEFVPTNYMNLHQYHGKLLGTDHWYSTVNGTDHYSDIVVGRMPVNDPDEALMVVNKTIRYERNPPNHQGFYENITLAAYFQDNDRDGYADRRFAQTTEETMVFIENLSYSGERIYYASPSADPQYWNLGSFSSGEPIPSYLLRSNGFKWDGDSSDIDSAIERGTFLLTHRDHGASWGWGDPRYTTSDIPNLDNGELLPVVLSINCLTGMMDHETANDTSWGSAESFSERFLTREGGGAVGVIGATRVSYSGYNDYFFRGMIDAVFPTHDPGTGNSSGLFRMGDVLNYGKYYMANTWGDWVLEFELFHYFGDPTMEIWTSEPDQLNVSYPSDVSHGSTEVRVNTSEDGVLVCISQDGRIVGRGRSLNGHVNITAPPLFAGTYNVTVTGHDLRPHIGIFNVTSFSTDLAMANITGPRSGEAGADWTCSGVVTNNGVTSEIGVNVSVELDGILVNSTILSAVPVGIKVPVSLNWTPYRDGWHRLSLKVRSSGQEVSVYDNEVQMDVRVFGEPGSVFHWEEGIDLWARTGEVTNINFTIGNDDLGELRYSVRPDLIFHDDFDGGVLDGEKWESADLSQGIVDYALNVPSGPSCISITDGEHLRSVKLNTSGFENISLSFMLRMGGFHFTSEPYDQIVVRYLNDTLQWKSIYSRDGIWYREGKFSRVTIDLPSDAGHSDLQFSFQSASGGDYFGDGPTRFYIDDVSLSRATSDHFLSVTNGSGSIGYGEEGEFTVVVNGTSLPPAYYNTVLYLTTNDPGSYPVNVSVEIRENVTPMAEAGSDVIIGQHEKVPLDGSNSTDNTGIINWTWMVSDLYGVSLYYEERSEHTFHEAGEYTAELKVHDYALNYAWDNFTITVLDTTDPIADAGVDLIIDQHETVVFNASSSMDNVGIVDYGWEFTDGSDDIFLTGPAPSYTFDEAGRYNINLTAKDAMGNNGTDIIVVTVRDITEPTVDAGPDMVVNQSEVFILNGSLCYDNVGIVNWTWNLRLDGGDLTLHGVVVELSIKDAGSFPVTLNVSDGPGNYDIDSLIVTVLDITPPTVITQGDVVVDQFSTLVLNATGSKDNVGLSNLTWEVRGEDFERALHGPSPSIVFNKVGVYEAVLFATDLSMNVGNSSFRITVIDREIPRINFSGDLLIDQHQELVLNASSSTDNVGIISYIWKVHLETGTVTLEGAVNSTVIDDAGSYSVDLNVSDAMGNWAAMTLNITVRDTTRPVPVVELERRICTGNSTVFNASGSKDNVGIVHYRWNFTYDGRDIVLEGKRVEFTFDIPGNYNITLTIRDGEGNEIEETYNITVLSPVIADEAPSDDHGEISWALLAVLMGGTSLLIFLVVGILIFLGKREKGIAWEE